ncbi:hypothetical protein ACLD4C_14635, partial [Salmonella sp. 741265071_PSA]
MRTHTLFKVAVLTGLLALSGKTAGGVMRRGMVLARG